MFTSEVAEHFCRVALRLRNLHSRLQASDYSEEVWRHTSLVEHEWHPQINFDFGELEIGRHHADDLSGGLIQAQHATHNIRVATKTPLPERITNHADEVPALRVFTFHKRPTKQRIDAKDFEKIGINIRHRQAFRLAETREVDRGSVVKSHCFKRSILFLVSKKIGLRNTPRRKAQLRTRLNQVDQSIRFAKRQWAQQNAVDETKNCGVRADAKRQSNDSNESKPRLLHENSRAIREVLKYFTHSSYPYNPCKSA